MISTLNVNELKIRVSGIENLAQENYSKKSFFADNSMRKIVNKTNE
jgi:hypothetical protein